VALRGGGTSTTEMRSDPPPSGAADEAAAFDLAWLRSRTKPRQARNRGHVRLVDLFSGCGALTLGITEACRALGLSVEHVFAADSNPVALDTYARNFPGVRTTERPLETMVEERRLIAQLGAIDVLAGGPPCQGNSDLNNHTRRQDPKNALFLTMVRFAQLLRPAHLIIENVQGVRHDKGRVTEVARRVLESMGYQVSELLLNATELGVPQRRRRYMMVASRGPFSAANLHRASQARTLRWACEDVRNDGGGMLDSRASSSPENQKRIDYLFDHQLYDLPDEQRPPCHRLKAHSYNSVYGRLHWDEPAPTITSGFNSPGQGRFIHPQERRTLTPHEAARLQFIPDFFAWGAARRESLMQMIGNAVPPKLGYAVALELLR